MCGLFTYEYICVVLVVNVGEYTIHIHTPSIWVCTIHAMSTLDYPWPLRKKSDSWLFRLPTLQMFIARHVTWGLKMPQLKKNKTSLKEGVLWIHFDPPFEKRTRFLLRLRKLEGVSQKKRRSTNMMHNLKQYPSLPSPKSPPIVLQLKINQET